MFVNMEGIYFLSRLLNEIFMPSKIGPDYVLFVCFMHDKHEYAFSAKLVNKLIISLAWCDVEEIVEDEITRECLDQLCVGWAAP